MKLVVDFRGGCSNILAPYNTNLQVAGIPKQSLRLKTEGSGPIDWSETHSSGPIPLCQNETSINQLFKVTLHKSDLHLHWCNPLAQSSRFFQELLTFKLSHHLKSTSKLRPVVCMVFCCPNRHTALRQPCLSLQFYDAALDHNQLANACAN